VEVKMFNMIDFANLTDDFSHYDSWAHRVENAKTKYHILIDSKDMQQR